MSEFSRPSSEEYRDEDVDRKKYTDAIRKLFPVLLDFRKTFGSAKYHANEVHAAASEQNNAFGNDVATGTISELEANYMGLEVGVRVNLIDDLGMYTAQEDGDNTNPEPFIIDIWAKKGDLHFNYATNIYIGTKSAYEDGVLWSDETVPPDVIEAMWKFVAYFRSYDENMLAADYGNIEELKLDAADIANVTQGLQRFMDDSGVEYQIISTTNEVNERMAGGQS